MNSLDTQYQDLLRDILENGTTKNGRNGKTISVFGRTIRHKMSEGFPFLTTKQVFFKTMLTELLWFLRGDQNIQWLIKNGCKIWTGDAYKVYTRSFQDNPAPMYSKKDFEALIANDDHFASVWGDMGAIYGAQWRNWNKTGTDQIVNLIEGLKSDPDSRRHMVSAWNVSEIDYMVLPPCHYSFQCWTRELSESKRREYYYKVTPNAKNLRWVVDTNLLNELGVPERGISLLWNQRSADTALGIPFNLASYGTLLSMIGKQVNMIPEDLIGNIGDCHIYENQIDGVVEQLRRSPYELPTLQIRDKKVQDISEYSAEDFEVINYQHHPKIDFPLSN